MKSSEYKYDSINTIQNTKEIYAKIILFSIDIVMICFSLCLAYVLRNFFSGVFDGVDGYPLSNYTHFYLLYIIIMFIFIYEGIYSYRYDFWHESQVILESLIVSFFIIFTYLALTRTIEEYSRGVLLLSFFMMLFLLPTAKNMSKKLLFNVGLWKRKVKIYGDDAFLKQELFNNHYLGYVDAHQEEAKTVFVNVNDKDSDMLKNIINAEMKDNKELIFVPIINDYDLTQSKIHQLFNTRTNLVVFRDNLKSKYKVWIKRLSDSAMFIIIFPLLVPILLFIAYKIRKEEPNGSILFKQERLGKNNTTFTCYKFRTMFEESDGRLSRYLEEHPEEIAFYEMYHKYQNDPRITRIGHVLRKTSLDELPQIFNVFKNEMSFIGPRPYMVNEADEIGKDIDTVLAVLPGITGLWQVSGRSDVDFSSRVSLDVWYIQNWNLWMDVVILLKTVKTVFLREGAQ